LETLVDFQQATWRYTPEDKTLHNHCCENLKSYKKNMWVHMGSHFFLTGPSQ
jgi:hypothetical protein